MLDDITLEIETVRGKERVVIPFDFTDFTPVDIERVGVLTEGTGDPVGVACAFLFVAASRQMELNDDEFVPFREGLAPMFDGDASMLVMENG